MGILEYIEELQKKIDIEKDPKALENLEDELFNAQEFCREHYGE